ncbi:hypothetical protein [Micromonospora vulcania]|uniref:HTH cro/C1-type domain-containing protein n=1 Tax=Micromonospora vulcania TaxID=1441873 RepID=A0ABW1H5I9_9ACTN
MIAAIVNATLDYARIRTRAGEVGLSDNALTSLLGVRLSDFNDDLDQRSISLQVLVRLSQILAMSIDDLIITSEKHPEPTAPTTAGDDQVLLALAATYRTMSIRQVLDALDWTEDRLNAALATAQAHLAATPLRLIVTDQRLAYLILAGSVPADIQTRLLANDRAGEPLRPQEAAEAMRLVHDRLLAPFPDERSEQRPTPYDLYQNLIARGLALPDDAAGPADPDRPHLGPRVKIHPDVMFALRLTSTPAEVPAEA